MKNSGKSGPRLILHILMLICAVGIVFSGIILFIDSREYTKGAQIYEQLRLIREPSEAKKEQPDKGIDFTSLESINPDVVGWLASENAEIDYPLVQGTDNEFYLSHMFTGERNKTGSLFMDYRNQRDFSDKNTIIYGHNMKDGSMFSSLMNYKDQSYYDSFPTAFLYTSLGNFTIELFAGIVVDGDYESVRLDFKDEYDFQSYIDSLKLMSTFQSDTSLSVDDRIITLSTCSYEFNNARYTLYGKLSPSDNQ